MLAVGLVCTAAVSLQLLRSTAADDAARFEHGAQIKLNTIADRLENHIALLRGGAGLLAASPEVSREEFARYVRQLRLRERYPGMQGIGFSRRIEPERLAAFTAAARDAALADFRVWPSHPRAEYHAILYLEPLDERNRAAIGFDMFTEPTRREAMARARDSGTAAASGRVELVQEIDEDRQPGFLIYVPVYEGGADPGSLEERRRRLLGFVYGPYRTGDLFAALFAGELDPELDHAVYDGAALPQNLLHSSRRPAAAAGGAPALSAEKRLAIGGRSWTVTFAARPAFERGSGRELVRFVAGGGLLATLLLAGLAFSQAHLTQAEARARAALREANLDLQETAAFRAAILGQLAEGVIVTDADGRITFVNEAANRLHGIARLDVPPERYSETYRLYTLDGHPHPSEELPLARAVLKGETVTDERWRIRRPDGSEILAVGSARPVHGAYGARLGSVLTLRDDTQREADEQSLRRLNEALAERARELRDSYEEIQRYAYIVSHDLRAPLVNIMGFTSELETLKPELLAAGAKPADDPERRAVERDFDESLGFIKAAIAKMDTLIGAILKISREGRRAFRPEPLDMNALVRTLVDAQRHQIEAARAEVAIGSLPPITADRLAVEQVFGNLIDNAVKYLDPGRPGRIAISGEDMGAQARYEIRDNGRGIAARDHERVFELFRRAGVQDRPGEGIGLAHVKALIRSLGGRIDLSSEPGVGTTFTVILPKRGTERQA